MADFEFNEEVIEVTRVVGNRKATNKFPAEGSRIGVVYINASNGLAAIQTKLDEIQALCDEYQQLDWVAEAKPDCIPGVRIVVTARNDIPEPIPEP